MNKAAIDIGSNSVRLYLTDANKKYINSSMLARGMKDGFLNHDSIARTVNATCEFIALAKSVGCDKPVIFATEAVRAAKNRQEFLSELAKHTDIAIDILSGSEEAEVAFLGASQQTIDNVGVIDIGGASVEFAYGSKGKLLYNKSLPLGAIALKNIIGDDRQKLSVYASKNLKAIDSSFTFRQLFGVGGTLTALAAMDLGLEEYQPERVHGHTLTLTRLNALADIIFKKDSILEIFKTLSSTRVEIIKQGVIIAIALLTHLNRDSFTVSEKDNLEGYLIFRGL